MASDFQLPRAPGACVGSIYSGWSGRPQATHTLHGWLHFYPPCHSDLLARCGSVWRYRKTTLASLRHQLLTTTSSWIQRARSPILHSGTLTHHLTLENFIKLKNIIICNITIFQNAGTEDRLPTASTCMNLFNFSRSHGTSSFKMLETNKTVNHVYLLRMWLVTISIFLY